MKSQFRNLCLSICLTAGFASAQVSPSGAPDVESRINQLLGRLTLEQKIDLLGGVDGFNVPGLPEIGLPKMRTSDGPLGTRNDGPATAMAGGIGLAATWSDDLAREVGLQIGRDARARGVHFMLGPGVNIYKSPRNGRNFEYFGEDPLLASHMAVSYIEGMQSQNVSATVKHFMGNNSEFDRHNVDSIIDERAMREIYLPSFEAAVKEARVGAVMDSYNLTNGSHMTQNGYLNTEVVKKEWGFDGIIMSDWLATYDGVAAANGGLDLEMPSGAFMNRKTLLPAIKSGQVTEAVIDDKVRRVLRTAIRFGWMDHNQTSTDIPLDNQDGSRVALQAAEEGMVLLKNDGGLLPLSKSIKSIAVIGPDAYPAVPVAGGSAQVAPFSAIGFMEGLSTDLAGVSKVYYSRGVSTLNKLANQTRFTTADGRPGLLVEHFDNPNLTGNASKTTTELHINHKAQFTMADLAEMDMSELFASFSAGAEPPKGSSERWTGTYTVEKPGQYEVFAQVPGENGGHRLIIDGKTVLDNWTIRKAIIDHTTIELTAGAHTVVFEQFVPGAPDFFAGTLRIGIVPERTIVDPVAKTLAAQADAVVVCVGFDPDSESEGADRTFDLPVGQDELIREITAVNPHVVVVATSGGAVKTSSWLDQVPSFIEAWYPGQNGGTALAKIVLGDVDPSGRLPISYDRDWNENPSHDSYYPQAGNKVEYKDGIFVGYRGYEHEGKTPAFPFGYGLSYTTYKYANIRVHPDEQAQGSYKVSFDVTNTGTRAGKEVAQVYVGEPHPSVPRPVKELKGFAKVELQPGETKTVTLELNSRAFSYYDTRNKRWQADAADYDVLVGSSSADIALKDKITLKSTDTAATIASN